MSCPNATAPIDIVKNNAGVCDKKCDISYDYPNTSVVARNKGEYLRFSFDKSSTPPVFFNKEKYEVQEMRLFQPSLHTFSGSRASGEIIIVHNNLSSSRTLLVCIPLVTNALKAAEVDALINQVAQKANTLDSSTNINLNAFSLKKIVPTKPYFFYTGTLPYSPCNGKNDIIVYGKDDAISITASSFVNLKRIVTASDYEVHTAKNGFFYNQNGPSNYTGGEDDIYFECNPTGSDGETLVAAQREQTGPTIDVSKYSWVLGAIFGAILLYALLKFFGIAFNKIFSESQSGGATSQVVNTNS